MFRFPKFDVPGLDLSKFDLSKFDLSKFDPAQFDRSKSTSFHAEAPDPARFGLGAGGHAARAARMKAAMARFQREQAAALARWAETHRSPADPAGAGGTAPETLDMEAPATPGGAWTAREPDKGAAPDRGAAPDWGAGIDLSAMRRAARPAGVGPAGGAAPAAVPDGARFETRTFTGPAGSRSYKVYVPSGCTGQPLPLVVMLHGCTQNPDDFAAGTRMNALAEAQTFLVAYPGQSQAANMQRCWNWYAAGDQAREGGEPELIAGIARAVIAEFGADPTRVYAAGLSAGGAAAAILAATYPDLFAAVGVHSGLACGSARDMPSAFAAMKGQAAVTGRNRRAVPTIVFHGDGDRTVHPANGDQVIAQAMAPGDLAATVTRGTSPGGIAYTRTVRRDASGRPLLEQWTLHGAGHAWSGGSPDGSYTEPRGPDASDAMIRFFLSHRLGAGGRA